MAPASSPAGKSGVPPRVFGPGTGTVLELAVKAAALRSCPGTVNRPLITGSNSFRQHVRPGVRHVPVAAVWCGAGVRACGFGRRPAASFYPPVRKPGGTPVEPAAVPAAQQKNPAVAVAARALRQVRREIIRDKGWYGWSLRGLHKSLETPREYRLHEALTRLAAAVQRACGMKPDEDSLAFPHLIESGTGGKRNQRRAVSRPPACRHMWRTQKWFLDIFKATPGVGIYARPHPVPLPLGKEAQSCTSA